MAHHPANGGPGSCISHVQIEERRPPADKPCRHGNRVPIRIVPGIDSVERRAKESQSITAHVATRLAPVLGPPQSQIAAHSFSLDNQQIPGMDR